MKTGRCGILELALAAVMAAGMAFARDAALANAPYLDPTQPIDARVDDLVARMTVPEKLAQLGKMRAFLAYERTGDAIAVSPGETKTVTVPLDRAKLGRFDARGAFVPPTGEYEILVDSHEHLKKGLAL